MRVPSFRRVTVPLAGAVLVLSSCSAEENAPPAPAVPCAIVANGTTAPKTSTAAAAGSPEVATGYRKDMTDVHRAHYAVATANPLASQSACEVLEEGGPAADALVAARTMLGLVEPQASGIGGGGFLLYYDAEANSVQAYDGREVAPAAATENYLRWVSDADRTQPKPDARASGRSIGVPGILRLPVDVHHTHGKTAWRDLFSPAIALADDGFGISPGLATAIADAAPQLRVDPQTSGYFLNPDGSPKSTEAKLTNPAYSKTLGIIASDPQSFYTGDIARDIVAAATDTSGGQAPSLMTVEDLAGFSAEPVGPDGVPVANRVGPDKRPRSTIAPTLVFDGSGPARGPLYATVGSPGVAVIIQFVVKTVVGIVDWGMDPLQAVGMVDFGAANTPKTNVGGEHPNIDTAHNEDHDPLVQGLRKLGHQVDLADQSSGLSAIVRQSPGWRGGADPCHEGLVMGDPR